jgi:hypothetical protein
VSISSLSGVSSAYLYQQAKTSNQVGAGAQTTAAEAQEAAPGAAGGQAPATSSIAPPPPHHHGHHDHPGGAESAIQLAQQGQSSTPSAGGTNILV